ncbi:MAG TPA: hypothetical protein VGY56_10740 [Verrucomicrobiae bacterium]|nr:hypothetical protein [Verrucomicrobiae bacterium]
MRWLQKLFEFFFPTPRSIGRPCDLCGKEPATTAKTEDYALCDRCDAEGNAI